MTDRELLERAAKTAGIALLRSRLDDPMWGDMLLTERVYGQGVGWNPLTDDGDALRLAVTLRLNITFTHALGRRWADEFMQVCPSKLGHLAESGPIGDDPSATIRRAIVRAAAAIGEQTP